MFVNLPVTDLERAKAFYTAIGFTINPLFTDHSAASVVVEDGHSYFHDPGARLLPELHRPADRRPGGDRVGGEAETSGVTSPSWSSSTSRPSWTA